MDAVIVRENRFANPWIWLGAGVLCCPASAALSIAEQSHVVGAIAVTMGLGLVGIALTIRLNSSAPPFVNESPAARAVLLLAMTVFQCVAAMLICGSLLAAFLGVDPLNPSRSTMLYPPPLRPGLAIILW